MKPCLCLSMTGILIFSYCMRVCRHEVPEVWICEDCIPEEGTFGRNENFKDSCITVRHDVAIGGGSAKVYGDSGWHRARHCKRLKPVETGKVKFLSTEEVIKLSSGAAKTAFSSKANLGYRPNSSSAVSPVKLKPNPRIISSGLMKPPGFGRIQVDSSTSQQAPIISKGDNCFNNFSCREHYRILSVFQIS